jgi:F-type H+-transporting ATPase subunit alpha
LIKVKYEQKGRIKDIKDIIVRISGLPSCLNGQIVNMGGGVKGIIMGFDETDVLALVLGDSSRLRMGNEVVGISEPFRIPVSNEMIGRILTALCEPADEQGEIKPEAELEVFKESPPIIHRAPVSEFLPTGTKIVDIMVPLSKGQRLLILGDRMTGKTVIALDAILNQKEKNMICIYCCIGKSISALEKVLTVLNESGALSYTIVLAATDNSPIGEQYIVPFSAATVAQFFAGQGKDVLVVFDDLTKHAWAYRQLSLLLDRPPGREAYPGDIFYVQTQLMERAGKFSEEYGGGSITFLGIAETLEGDLTGYIPSNLSSMCDGQICTSSAMFAEGFRPAIDFTLSSSIIGGRVQPKILKTLSRGLRAQYAQYLEVLTLSKLQSGLSGEAAKVIKRGESIISVLQQGQYSPVGLDEMVLLLYALQKEFLLDMTPDQRVQFRKEIYKFAMEHDKALLDEIVSKQELTPEIEISMNKLILAYLEASGIAGKKK